MAATQTHVQRCADLLVLTWADRVVVVPLNAGCKANQVSYLQGFP